MVQLYFPFSIPCFNGTEEFEKCKLTFTQRCLGVKGHSLYLNVLPRTDFIGA
jgi:hypothetical protein